jgi:hypothetical protein
MATLTCRTCGVEFSGSYNRVYCSKQCRAIAMLVKRLSKTAAGQCPSVVLGAALYLLEQAVHSAPHSRAGMAEALAERWRKTAACYEQDGEKGWANEDGGMTRH